MFVDFEKRTSVSFSHIEQTVSRFTRIHERLVEDVSMLNAVEEQFLDYPASVESDIPESVGDPAQITDEQHAKDVTGG